METQRIDTLVVAKQQGGWEKAGVGVWDYQIEAIM